MTKNICKYLINFQNMMSII